MLSFNHIFVAFIFVVILPAFVDFLLLLLRLTGFTATQNPVAAANGQSLRLFLATPFSGRKPVSYENFICLALTLTSVIFSFAVTVAVFDGPFEDSKRVIFVLFASFTAFTAFLRAMIYTFSVQRIDYSQFLANFTFTSTTLLLIYAGFGLSLGKVAFSLWDLLLFLIAQILFSTSFKGLYKSDSRLGIFGRHLEMTTRIGANLLLITFLLLISEIELRREFLLPVLLFAVVLEVLNSLLSLDSPKMYGKAFEQVKKYIIALLAIVIALRVII